VPHQRLEYSENLPYRPYHLIDWQESPVLSDAPCSTSLLLNSQKGLLRPFHEWHWQCKTHEGPILEAFQIRPLDQYDRLWAARLTEEHCASTKTVTRGRVYEANELPVLAEAKRVLKKNGSLYVMQGILPRQRLRYRLRRTASFVLHGRWTPYSGTPNQSGKNTDVMRLPVQCMPIA